MGFYAIGIGGTGAKCIESLTHLAAAGLLPKGDLYTVFVDPDRSNGSLERAEITISRYVECQKLPAGDIDLFRTSITISEPDVWSPFGNEAKPKLADFFAYNVIKESDTSVSHLFDVLYSPREKDTLLDEGFRGHPSIGAAVMSKTIDLGVNEPWKTFWDKIAQDVKTGQDAVIVLFGSIFGGTGASGISTIARLIKDQVAKMGTKRVRLGGVIMLPYFSFERIEDTEMRAEAENFLLSTQAALKYYSMQDYLEVYDAIYLLGEHTLSPLGPSPKRGRDPKGGKDQKNEPHFVEIYAGLAAIDFFENQRKNYFMIARQNEGRLTWDDLHNTPKSELKAKLGQLARFAFSFLSTYYPMLMDIRTGGKSYRAPWYVDLVERGGVDISKALDGELAALKSYCESFLMWLANVHVSAKDLRVELVDFGAFAQTSKVEGRDAVTLKEGFNFNLGGFGGLILPTEEKMPNALDDLWRRMSDRKDTDRNARDIGKLVGALYRECVNESEL
jgi:hypothetical protein